MRKMRTQDRRHTRAGFTLAELLIVIIIIVILAVISLSAYFGVLRGAKERAAGHTLKAVSNAVQAFYNETRDYPAMRFSDLGLTPSGPFAASPLPNADQSIAALVYQLQYRSSAGDLIKNLPSAVLVPLNITVTDPPPPAVGGQTRPLYTIHDPWTNAIQYLRPRGPVAAADNEVSAPNLNNRVLLVSMGKDGRPGQEGGLAYPTLPSTDPKNKPTWTDLYDGNQIFPNPGILKLGKADDILVQVGSAQ